MQLLKKLLIQKSFTGHVSFNFKINVAEEGEALHSNERFQKFYRLMRINKADVLWNYAATFLRVASYALLLPFILRTMAPEMVGVWSVFIAINSFAALLDLGFSPSFTRNVTYIFSGVKALKVSGFQPDETGNTSVDYGLLKGIIATMQWFYLRMAVILFVVLTTLGTWYIHTILKKYNGNHTEVYAAWVVLCIICTCNIYTQYYDCLLQGKGMVKISKQIVITGQVAYLIIAAVLIMSKFGLLAIISAQAVSVVIIRWLTARSFFTKEINEQLQAALPRDKTSIMKAIYPNAVKIGLTAAGAFVIQRASVVIGSLFLPLSQIASYGVTVQLVSMIANFSTIYILTYIPKIVQFRIADNTTAIKQLYLKGQVVILLTFLAGGSIIFFLGTPILHLIGSKTELMPLSLILLAVVISFLETNHAMAGNMLLTKNEVPFFKASLVAGVLTVLLLTGMLNYTNLGIAAMVFAPGIAQLYNNFRWPYALATQLHITTQDIKNTLKQFARI